MRGFGFIHRIKIKKKLFSLPLSFALCRKASPSVYLCCFFFSNLKLLFCFISFVLNDTICRKKRVADQQNKINIYFGELKKTNTKKTFSRYVRSEKEKQTLKNKIPENKEVIYFCFAKKYRKRKKSHKSQTKTLYNCANGEYIYLWIYYIRSAVLIIFEMRIPPYLLYSLFSVFVSSSRIYFIDRCSLALFAD